MYLERNSSNHLYLRWTELRRRCRRPRQDSYIKKDIWWSEEFNTFLGFRSWALASGFKDELSLDRIDNSLGYSPSNCKWSTRTEQQYNQHKITKDNLSSNHRGVSLDKRRNTWRARIYINKKEVAIGYFKSENEAALAYNNKLDELGINAPRNVVLDIT